MQHKVSSCTTRVDLRQLYPNSPLDHDCKVKNTPARFASAARPYDPDHKTTLLNLSHSTSALMEFNTPSPPSPSTRTDSTPSLTTTATSPPTPRTLLQPPQPPQTFIGSVALITYPLTTQTIMPHQGLSSYASAVTTTTSNGASSSTASSDKKKSIYVVLQHSKSAASSRLLPYSNIIGIFHNREDARQQLRQFKSTPPPRVKGDGDGERPQVNFWCTTDDSDEDADGFEFVSEVGEDYVVWIEEHEIAGDDGEGSE